MSNDDPQQVDSFRQRVYAIVAAIPPGHVTTYGTVARRLALRAPRARWAASSADYPPTHACPGTGW